MKNLITTLTIIIIQLSIINTALAQDPFQFTLVSDGDLAWGDYNNDSFDDLLLTGEDEDGNPISKIYKNNNGNGTFTDVEAGLTGVYNSSVDWGDYDDDGNLDILLTGISENNDTISIIYKNNGDETFFDINAGLLGVTDGSVAWGDYNNDSYLDILLTGMDENNNRISEIYKYNNSSGIFEDINAGLPGVTDGSVAWGDYNNDGYLDILLTGDAGSIITKIYKNIDDGSGNRKFELQPHNLADVYNSSCDWEDYNNDGCLDIILTGRMGGLFSGIYKCNSADYTYNYVDADLVDVHNGSVKWGDYDNDNDLDILLTGEYWDWQSNLFSISKIYKNNGDDTFTDINADITNVSYSSVAWNDYNNDGNLDFIISGNSEYGKICKLYTNEGNGIFNDGSIKFPDEFHECLNISAVAGSSVAWGDYNNDNLLDILLTGVDENSNKISKIYKNTYGNGYEIFTEINAGLTGVYYSSVAWGDYNNDNLLDVLLTGADENSNKISKIYKNNGDETFTDINVGLPAVSDGSVAWGDYDNNDTLDILITGYDGANNISKIYRNNGNGNFEDINAGLTDIHYSSVAWFDYDNNDTLDILITGYVETSNYISKIYRNNGNGNFTDINAGLPGVSEGSVSCGDYNNDNYIDILLTGYPGGESAVISKIYRNNGNGNFEDINAGLTGVFYASAEWGDYNNDTFLDILLTGYDDNVIPVTKLYKNNGDETFTEIDTDIKNIDSGSVAWGDYNNDNFLDILLTGEDENYDYISKIYKNKGDGTFTEYKHPPNFTKVYNSSGAWGDYDKNGYQDYILSGNTGTENITEVFNNSEEEFVRDDISLTILEQGKNQWFDFNNDGYLDLIITGKNYLDVPISKIYQNGGNGVFINSNIDIEGVYESSVDCADYNNDGLSDLLIAGKDAQDNFITKLYKNLGNNNFQETFVAFPGASKAKLADINNDNYIDIFLVVGNEIIFYKNNGNDDFENYEICSETISGEDIELWDLNEDSFIDILTDKQVLINTGNLEFNIWQTMYHRSTEIYSFDYDNSGLPNFVLKDDYNNGFESTNIFNVNYPNDIVYDLTLPEITESDLSFSDLDNDGDLDFVLSGKEQKIKPYTELIINNCQTPNTKPNQPDSLRFECNADTVFISWNMGSDLETPDSSLTYNCYMYETGGDTIWHSLSNHGTGKRYIPKEGNVQHNTSWFIQGLDVTKEYAWSVQAVDYTFEGSTFAPEKTFRLAPAFVIQPINQTVCETGSITFNTSTTPADEYQWYQFTETDTIIIENNEHFSNATSLNLTISNAILDMHNYELHCAATTVGGTTFSEPAILGVDTLILADAGVDTFACDVTEIQLHANLPSYTAGLWSCENQNVTFDDDTNPDAVAYNIPEDVSTTVKWSLTQQNVCGENSDLVIVTQYPSYVIFPAPPTPTGETDLCFGSTASYETAGIGYAIYYLWELAPSEAGITNDNGLITTVNWNPDYNGFADIRVKAQNECYYGEWSEYLTVTVNPSPNLVGIPSGENEVCVNGQTAFSTSGAIGADSYKWLVSPEDAGVITGTSSNITAVWQNSYQGTAYVKVKGINQCGEGVWSDSLQVIISSPEVSDIIQKSENMLVSVDSGYAYQWYLNGNAVNGANKQYYYNENMATGDYSIEITDENECKSLSGIYTFGNVNKSLPLSETIQIYPNPTTGKITIEIDNDLICKVKYTITDNLGRKRKEDIINKQQKFIKFGEDISALNPGNYLIEFTFNNEKKSLSGDLGVKVSKQLIIK